MQDIKHRLLATTLLAGCIASGFGSSALAQDDSATVDELVVTGSRIPRPNFEQPTPVATISQQLIQNAGTQNLGDIISQLPGLSSTGTVRGNGNSFDDFGGLNFPNLRGLGVNRTLTLVDGRRHVAGDAGRASVDLNSIPPALVDRVEVITGGASAVYGSDAVSGVVNIITKKDFEGLEFQVERGEPTASGHFGRNTSAWVTVGKNFDNNRANVTFSAFWDQAGAVRANDIRSLNNYGSIINSDQFDGEPDRILTPRVYSEYIDENTVLLDANFSPLTGFTAAGTPVAQPLRTGDNSFAFGSFAGDCATCFKLEDWMLLVTPTRRAGLAATFNYEITPNIKAYFDGKFVQTKVHDYVQPSFSFGDYLLEGDNAFITPAIQQVLNTSPGDIYISRFMGDLGARINNIERQTYRFVAGLEGKFDGGFSDIAWELSYNRGQTKNLILSENSLLPGNFEAAIDAVRDPATGQIRCRVDVPSLQGAGYAAPSGRTSEACVPYNVFGQQNSAAALDYVSHEAVRSHKLDQDVVSGSFTLDTERFLKLPGGPIGFAGGFEYRKEHSQNINDPLIKAGLSDTAPQPDASGGFHVWEGFAEASLPLLRDLPGFEELTIDGAIRYADYSTVGSATGWRGRFLWAPVKDLKFRGTYSKAVRAPNIREAFLPSTAGFADVTDPCDADEINTDPDRSANCAALGVPAGFQANDNAGVEGTTSGNPNLDPERSKSWTLGAVIEPRWTPGLSLTIDYFNIRIKDAITEVDSQDILDNCVDASGGPDSSFCSLFTRGSDGNIDFIASTFLNASALETNGWDIALAYNRDVDFWKFDGRFTGSITATHLDKFRLFAFQDRPDEVDIEEGTLNNPEWKVLAALSYRQGPVEFGWKSRFLSRTVRYDRDPQQDGAEALSPSQVEAVWYHDAVVRYRFDQIGRGAEVYVGVNNIFDEEIPLGLVQGDGTDASYDLVGRYAFVGLRAKF